MSTELYTTWAILAFGAIGAWFTLQHKVEQLKDKDTEQGRQIDALWKWKDLHEKEAVVARENFQSQLSELRGSLLVTNEQFKQILGMLQDIRERLTKIEDKK